MDWKKRAELADHFDEHPLVVEYRMDQGTFTLLVYHIQVAFELDIHFKKRNIALYSGFNQVSLTVRLHVLHIAWVVPVPPKLLTGSLVFHFDPVGHEQILIHAGLGVVELRERPLEGIGVFYLEVEEALFSRCTNPFDGHIGGQVSLARGTLLLHGKIEFRYFWLSGFLN